MGLSEYNTIYPTDQKGIKGKLSPLSGLLSFQGEFGIAKYVGIGFFIGINYSHNLRDGKIIGLWNDYNNFTYNFWNIGIPVGVISNFHFLQLINDKSGKTFAEKLDVYAGISVGTGPSFIVPRSGYKHLGGDIGPMFFVGPHAGIKFYPASNFGIYCEIGYGKAYLNGGVCFKL